MSGESVPSQQHFFDQYSTSYESELSKSVAISGEDSAYFARYKLDEIKRLFPDRHPQTIVDFGCGVGLLSELLAKSFPNSLIIGIDSSEQCIKEASQKTRGFKNIEFVSTSEMNLKNWGLKADLVILANVLHHVPNNERTAFVDMLAKFLLKSQGEVVVFEHNPLNFVTRLVVRFCPFDKGVQLLSRKSTRILFQNQHFQLLKQPFIVFFPKFLSFLRPLEKQLGWCPLGAQYLLYAKRMVKS